MRLGTGSVVLAALCIVWCTGVAFAHCPGADPSTSCWHGLEPGKGQNALSCLHYERLGPGTTECVYRTVESVVAKALHADPTNGGPLLRLHFHDCFVNGCDGSVLLDASYNKSTGNAEKDAAPNLTLDDFDIIDEVKAAVDATCSPDVSCADILAIVASVVVKSLGGPAYTVPLGRLDGCTSQKETAPHYLPSPRATVRGVYNGAKHSLKDSFEVQGLDLKDLVALSGAHTIGQAHCPSFTDRLCYGGQSTPVAIDKGLQQKLVNCCVYNQPGTCSGNISSPVPTDAPQVDLERGTPKQARTYPPVGGGLVFDNAFFKNIRMKMGLLTSDQALYFDPSTVHLVDKYADDQDAFFRDFVRSMVRMGNILPSNMGVKPGAGVPTCSGCSSKPSRREGSERYFESQDADDADDRCKGNTCPTKAVAGKPDRAPSCLAYKTNRYGIRRGTCRVAAPSCAQY